MSEIVKLCSFYFITTDNTKKLGPHLAIIFIVDYFLNFIESPTKFQAVVHKAKKFFFSSVDHVHTNSLTWLTQTLIRMEQTLMLLVITVLLKLKYLP